MGGVSAELAGKDLRIIKLVRCSFPSICPPLYVILLIVIGTLPITLFIGYAGLIAIAGSCLLLGIHTGVITMRDPERNDDPNAAPRTKKDAYIFGHKCC